MKKLIIALLLSTTSLVLFAVNLSAQTLLQYPILELGYCRDAKECYLFCEIPQNKAACWSYGQFRLGPQVLGVSSISPEEDAQMRRMAAEKGITFPIPELGNCSGPQECRDFCEQPANHATCMSFARKHGFGDEGGGDGAREAEILAAAQSELGCSAKESCFRICEQDHSRCEAFARQHGLYQEGEGQYGPRGAQKDELLQNAKNELGCTSMESCARVCQSNPERCQAFTQRYGLSEQPPQGSMGQYQRGPGGCDSEETCKAYCMEHPSECPGFQSSPSGGGDYVGPTGCRTEAECQAFCRANPSSCPGFSEAQSTQVPPPSTYTAPDPSSWCNAQPGCSWNGSQCTCSSPPQSSYDQQPVPQEYSAPVQSESQPAYSPPPKYPQEYPTP